MDLRINGGMDMSIDEWVGGWTGGWADGLAGVWMDRRAQAEITLACTQARRCVGMRATMHREVCTQQRAACHASPGTALCRMRRIPPSGDRRTGAQLQRERVDAVRGAVDAVGGAGSLVVEVNSTIDCVPVATGHVGGLQVIAAQATSVELHRDNLFGRTPACLLVVEREEARWAGRAV